MMLNDVVIVGAGPTGLMLARELQLAGVNPLVLERDASPNRLPRALGLGGRTIDILERRGLLARFEAAAAESPALPPSLLSKTPKLMHFGGVPLDLRQLPGAMPRFLNLLQNRTDQCFEACAIEAGVSIQRGHELRALEQTEDEVLLIVITPEGERRIRTRFVVGCDGAHSVVRKFADIPFPGLAPTRVLRLGDLKLPAEQLSPPGWRGGRPGFIPLADGFTRIVTNEPLPADLDRNAPMTFDELRESVRRLFDIVLVPTEIRWVSRSTDSSRLAERYRSGRVLLAGDAAHVHLPAGGPGINAGINDAMNLGWKLAATVRGTAPEGLLDTYHSERHAEGERLMSQTRAQGAMLQQTSVGAALREIVGGFLAHPAVLRDVVALQQGTDVRYAQTGSESASELVGCWAPELTLESPNGERTCISDQMRGGRALFVELADRSVLVDAVRPYAREVDVFVGSSPDSDSAVEAMLIRPDGHVGWACERGEDARTAVLGLERALQKWFTSSSPVQ
jgi:2-polyprenyl-6-methoxyphenol hydroxylase-like FAD-dependent oxidoreductase